MTSKMDKAATLLLIISMITNLALISLTSASSIDLSAILKVGDQSIDKCALTQDCDDTQLTPQSYESYFKTDKSSWNSLGLDPKLLQINQISLGFVPAFQEKVGANTPAEINKQLYKPMAIVGDYIALSDSDPELKAIDWHLTIIQKLQGNPVWCITLMPTGGPETVTWKVAHKIATKLAKVNKKGVTVWLKWMYEMNGFWNAWGVQPELFKEKWELVAKEVKQNTDRTYMLWSPNAMYADSVYDKRGGYLPYWPDPSTVDIVGISYYHWGIGAKRVNFAPTQDEAVGKLVEFAKIFGPNGWGKPVVVSETAASYTYYQDTNKPVEGKDSEVTIKMKWLHLLLDRYIKATVPGLKAVIWFEIVKNENATGDTPMRTEDFRLVTGNPDLANKVRELFRNYHYKEEQRIAPLKLD